MRRRAKPAKAARKSRKNEGSGVRDLEKRLAEVLSREAEAREQQAAAAEILRLIASSPDDAQPVFDAIAMNALRLCDAEGAVVVRYDGALLHVAAHHNVSPEAVDRLERQYPLPPDHHLPMGRAVLDRAVVHVPDLQAADEFSGSVARQFGRRSHVSIPLLHQGRAIGAIGISRWTPGPFSDRQIALLQTFADQAVIAIENTRLFKETKEALEQQTATSEILRVISGSPTDIQPVLDAVAASAARLCESFDSAIHRRDGDRLLLVAHHGPIPIGPVGQFTIPLVRGIGAGRAVLDARTIHLGDIQTEVEEFPEGSELARQQGIRTILSVPLIREGAAIGAIVLRRTESRLFTPRQVALLQTFADEAVIAIENVRLFTELQARNRDLSDALEQQTATSEILGVISRSPTEVEPVFAAVVGSAARLCEANDVALLLVEGDDLRLAAGVGPLYMSIPSDFMIHLTRGSAATRAVVDRATVHIHDFAAEPEEEFPVGRELARRFGHRTMLAVPLLREGVPIGVICAFRLEVRPFPEQQIALLRTFADQAVIAIENVRLFTELQGKNRALTQAHAQVTEALDQQTATGEILGVISSSPTDVQPVFDAIVRNAVQLCGARFGVLHRFDGERLHLAAHDVTAEVLEILQCAYPMRPSRSQISGRAILTRAVAEIRDVYEDPEYLHDMAAAGHWRSMLAVPMIRADGDPIGTIVVQRSEPGPFAASHIEMLKTFADQAVIAIENVRLFTELQEKNRALTAAYAQVTEALEQQTATAEILRVISASPTDLQPVLDALVKSAARFCGAEDASIFQLHGESLRADAHHGPVPQFADLRVPVVRGMVAGRTVLERRTVHVVDVQAEADEFPEAAAFAREFGFRTILSAPLIREGAPLGVIQLRRAEANPFTDKQVALLQTFADQAVIAIENVRLFNELQARTSELTRSVDELRALGEVGQAISSTLDLRTVLSTIVTRATQLSGTDAGVIYEYDEQRELFVPRATAHLEAEIVETMLAAPVRKGEGATGRLAEVQAPIQLPDILEAPTESRVRDVLVRAGYRALLAVPLVREDHLIGGLTVIRKATGEFAPEVIDLLRTFATQSALAIQNARLFREIEEKSRQLELASQHKSEFLANMSHELRTPLNAIIGFSEVLTERMFGDLNEKQEEYLKDIYTSGTHLLSLINDILDLSKIEAGRMELELTDFHLPQAIDNALTLVRERAGRRGIALQQSVEEHLGEIRGDERKVKQVLLNILSNALKFTPVGGRVEVLARVVDSMAEISVTDTGVGIAPEDQEAVFEEFRQVGTAEKKVEGTGLGLALCRKFVELHGGRIGVTSQVGVGSTFTFTIPVRRGE